MFHCMDYVLNVIYLQMDNSWQENKNQILIIFLAVLVKHKVFKKVQFQTSKYGFL